MYRSAAFPEFAEDGAALFFDHDIGSGLLERALHDLRECLQHGHVGRGFGHCFVNGVVAHELAAAVGEDVAVVFFERWIAHGVIARDFLRTMSV